ncbi:uncharacterized protein LOC130786570 isoform X2 [Actinidia eriantha]|uniref:uncharacterized protein LOC130755194 isoform X2 n=1 Tax=Actinidia eriantha TaxID=165200 RepID=UPI00258F9A15|nr:uncharacterized protein LOC130755194 isoform X2 [Actinidia eriantha]XP_057502852.1 uncharacterized protein LOC130786570 isoform X2 [Actinidia eriantha]
MAKGDKVLLSPGFIANCVPVYERERMENIRRNNEVCKSLGVKRITPASVGLVQHKRSTAKAKCTKRSNGELDDVDYRPQDDEDDRVDSDSSDSFEKEIIEMPLGGQPPNSYPEPQCGDNVMSERVTRSTPQSDMDSQSLLPPITQPQREGLPKKNVAINRRTRGPTRGIKAQRIIDKEGTLPIVIAPQFHAPIGEHAARMASKIGMEVRTHVMDLGVHRWKVVDDIVKAPILQRLTDKFDLQGNPNDVDKIVARQCGRTMSSFSYRLHKKYKELKDTKGEDYARNNPPSYVKPEQWTSLIEKKWSVKKWQARSEQNQKNRTTDKAKHRCKHRCGSKSLPVRVATAESLGVVSALAKVHKSTHFNKNTNEWITPESEVIHDKIEQIEVEQNSQDGAIPLTQEELSIKVFGRKSGYVTGLGMRPSSSSRNIVGHGDNIKYVTQLEQKVQEQVDEIQKQADKIQEQAKGIEAANNKIHELVEAKEEQGKTLASVMDYLKCQGYTG